MKHLLILLIVAFTTFSCAQEKRPLLGETEFQKEINAEYKDASKSPLKAKDRKNFQGLDFFEFDSTYVVIAKLVLTPDSKWFKMKTTTSRVSMERVYGVISFQINKNKYSLNVYQGQDLMKEAGYENYLFLPFLDNTNGETSYGGGRYIDLRIPKSTDLVIDFNKAYNPYCAYNDKYSCPIVPRGNRIDEKIEAGVKAFKKQ